MSVTVLVIAMTAAFIITAQRFRDAGYEAWNAVLLLAVWAADSVLGTLGLVTVAFKLGLTVLPEAK